MEDTDGNPINAHGGGILYHEGTYYWYGEFKGDSTIAWTGLKPGSAGGLKLGGWLAIHPRI